MAFPQGVKLILPVIINKNLVSGVLTNFIYQLDLTSYISQICCYIDDINEKNILVYDPSIDDLVPKYADTMSITDDKFFIYFSGSASNEVNKIFYVCFGLDIDVANDPITFSNSGFTNYWGLNEINGTSAAGYIGSRTGTVSANASLGNTGIFYKCASNNGTGSGSIDFDNEIIGAGDRTFEFLFKINNLNSGRVFTNSKCSMLLSTNYRLSITRNGSTFANSATNGFVAGNWYHVAVTSSSTGVTNFYINGTLSGTANQSAGTPSIVSTTNLILLNRFAKDTALDGYLDELGFTSNILSTDYITTRYNQYFNTSFWSYGSSMVITDPKKSYKYQYSISI